MGLLEIQNAFMERQAFIKRMSEQGKAPSPEQLVAFMSRLAKQMYQMVAGAPQVTSRTSSFTPNVRMSPSAGAVFSTDYVAKCENMLKKC
eukprot:SAG11_NODE_6103_length_1388_cov_1.131109_3_plen_90_part_00